jgi:hypothetical protein
MLGLLIHGCLCHVWTAPGWQLKTSRRFGWPVQPSCAGGGAIHSIKNRLLSLPIMLRRHCGDLRRVKETI